MARAWQDVTALCASVFYQPAFGDAADEFPGSADAVVNPAGPWPSGGTLPYAVFRSGGDRHYALTDGIWVPSDSSPPMYVIDGEADPVGDAPGVLALVLPTPIAAYGARVSYKLAAVDASGSSNMVLSIQPSIAEGTLSALPDPMTPGPFDDPWSTDDGEMGWAVVSPFTNNTSDLQVVERPPSEYVRPVQVVIASVGGFTGPRETFDIQAGYLEVHKIELYVDVVGVFWTDLLNAVEF